MTQQYNNNIQMPLFAPASGIASSQQQNSFWGDVDHLDVDILAEYLLDDIGTNSGGVSFDFPYVTIKEKCRHAFCWYKSLTPWCF